MAKQLIVYYDTPTEASDMYLKMIKKDAEEKGIKVSIAYDNDTLNVWRDNYLPLLMLEPHKCVKSFGYENIDGDSYSSATAQGIYDHIIERCPERENTISVIGRGLVGKQLIDMLIDYGYTVVEINSKTKGSTKENLLIQSDIIVGLSTTDNIIDEDQKDMIEFYGEKWWIDAGHNFDFDNRKLVSKCGKWTREVLFKRIEEL